MEQREFYVELLNKHVSNPKMIAHCLASEAVLRELARKFGEDEDVWGIAGLLHDLDVEITNADPKSHALVAAEMLQNILPAEAVMLLKCTTRRQLACLVLPVFSMPWPPAKP